MWLHWVIPAGEELQGRFALAAEGRAWEFMVIVQLKRKGQDSPLKIVRVMVHSHSLHFTGN